MTLYCYSTCEAIRELTADEAADYLDMIQGDSSHTGAVPGDSFGVPGVTVYAA
jgi:hypothetical protein